MEKFQALRESLMPFDQPIQSFVDRHSSSPSRAVPCHVESEAVLLTGSEDIPCVHAGNSYLGRFPDRTPGHYRMVSINVTLLISFSVVNPPRTLSSADSRRKRMPSSRAARRISDVGFFARIISRMRSVKSSNS